MEIPAHIIFGQLTGLSVIEAARQNILATFPLKNISEKLLLAASGLFSSLVKVSSKKHTWVSSSVVSTISKNPKIFNNRPVNKLVFPAFTTPTITSTQQAVTTAMVTPNPFVVPDEIFTLFLIWMATAAAHLPRWAKINHWLCCLMWYSLADHFSGVSDAGAWVNVSGHQRFSGWVASNLVPGTMFKIKMALLSSLFQLLPGCIGLKSVSRDAVKLFCMEFAFQECLNGATKVAIGDKIFLTTLKIAQSSGVTSVSSPSLSVALRNVPLSTSSDDIKSALGIFGVITSVKLKPVGLWQYAVVNFKDIFSAAAAFSNWSVLVRKVNVKILPIANQKEVISSRDAFKAKLVNLPFGCTAFEISDLVFQVGGRICQSLDHLAVNYKVLPPFSPKLSSNSAGGPVFLKLSLVEAKSYAKAATSVVLSVAAVANMGLAFSTFPKVVGPLLPVASSGSDVAVNTRLASLETQLSELSLLIKSIVEPVGSLVALVTTLLSTPPVMTKAMKESVIGLGNQIKAVHAVASVLQKEVEILKLRSEKVQYNISDDKDIDDDDDDDDAKNFSVYDDTFDAMIELWEVQSSNIKSDPDQTAKWMSSLVKSSHELVCIMGKMYELDMFNTLGSKDSTSV
ncbi:hypothetical protein G9A89_004489 [Geosiphon pyriformis]|nr:hypothetical protein G9A89_004489 [Geosiphon pyriformis]